MTPPTIGRIVWYHGDAGAREQAAIVANVNANGTLNLTVSDHNGSTFARQGVPLVQDGNVPPSGQHARWMPYQIGQAAKAEALAKQLAAAETLRQLAGAAAKLTGAAPQPQPPLAGTVTTADVSQAADTQAQATTEGEAS